MPADCGLRGIAFVCVVQSHERDCSLDSASVLVGGVDDVGEHLGVGVAGAGDGIHTGEGETANHGILERHNVFLVLTCKAVGFAMCCCLRYETGCVRAASQGRGSASVLVGVVDDVDWLVTVFKNAFASN